MIQIENYTLNVGEFTLRDVTMDIEDGEIFAILGQTGSGKTVLLESMAGFYEKFTGRILHDGTRHSSSGTPAGIRVSGFRPFSAYEGKSKYRVRTEDAGNEAAAMQRDGS